MAATRAAQTHKLTKALTADAAIGGLTQPKPEVSVRVADSLTNVVSGMGTGRDKRSYTGFSFPRILSRWELENAWRTSWLAKRIVGGPADDMTREWREFSFADDEKSPMIEALEKAEKALCVKERFHEGEVWGGLYGGAILVLGIKNQPDVSQPLDVTTVKKGDLVYLQVVDRWRVGPQGTVLDITSPSFGLPEFYMLAESSVMVHHTRVIRFDGEKIPYLSWMQNSRWHDSRLQHTYDALMNCDATTQSIASMMFEATVDVITKQNLDSVLAQNEDGEEKLLKRYALSQMMKGINRTLLLDGTETYEKKQTQFSGVESILGKFEDHVCGASGQPRTKLFGQSPGGLNATGDGDLRNWYDKMKADQVKQLTPKLNYFDEVFVRSTLGMMPDDYSFDWKPLWQVSDAEQGLLDFQRAQTDQIYINASVVTEGVVAGALKQRNVYPNMTNDDVDMATELAEKAKEAPALAQPAVGAKPVAAEVVDPTAVVPKKAAKKAAKKAVV